MVTSGAYAPPKQTFSDGLGLRFVKQSLRTIGRGLETPCEEFSFVLFGSARPYFFVDLPMIFRSPMPQHRRPIPIALSVYLPRPLL